MVNHDWFTHHLNKVHGTPNHTGPYPCKTSRETPCYIGMSQYLRNSRGPWLSCLPLSRSERPSSLAMIKSSISSYQDQLATFVGIVCQDKKARPQKHSELVLNLKNNQFNSWQSYRQGIHILQAQDLPFEAPKVR